MRPVRAVGRWVLVVMVVTACGGRAIYQVNVNAYAARVQATPLAPGRSVLVVWNPQASNQLLEREVADKIATLLAEKGYKLSTVSDTDFYLVFGYGIGSGPTQTGILPVYQPGRSVTVETWWGISGRSTSTIQLPGSTTYVPYTRTTNTRSLSIRVVEGQRFRERGEIDVVWAGDTVSTGSSGDLRDVLNYMLVATFDYFGGNTGKAVQLDLSGGDDRVKRLGEGATATAANPRDATVPTTTRLSPVTSPGREVLVGTYTGAISGDQQGQPISMRVTFTMIQEGSEVSGTWTTTAGSSGTLTGTIVGPSKLSVRVKQVNPCPGDFTGTATIGDNGATLGGSYSGRACGGAVTASFTVVRQ